MKRTMKTRNGGDRASPSERMPRRQNTKTFSGRVAAEAERKSAKLQAPTLKLMLDERDKSSAQVRRPAVSARKLGAVIWWLQSPEIGPTSGFQFEPSFKVSNSSTNFLKQAISSPRITNLEKQLKQAKARISELENEGNLSKQFSRKLSEESSAWMSREHEKAHAIVDDMKAKLSREKKIRQRLEMVHSELVNELAGAKLSVKRCLQKYGKEKKARELAEEVCKDTGEDNAEFEILKMESKKVWEEIEEERKLLQMGEVWREERVQMKLVDAKVMLEQKHSQMNKIITDLEALSIFKSTDTNCLS